MQKIKLSKYIIPFFETPLGDGSWFGYYNYDPLNYDQTKLLCSRAKEDAVVIKKGMKVDIGFYNLLNGEWNHISESDSFNWPQGAMLQWMPGEGNENKIIFNTSDGSRNIAKIINIQTYEEKTIDWSIYGITPNGKKSIALDMERAHWCRGYHYESIANPMKNSRIYEEDGIFEIDLENNTRKILIPIQTVINIDKESYFDIAKHWLEHIMINRSGTKFCFLHRYTIGALNDYETRLFVANIDGSNLQIIDGWRDFYWSHFGWNGDDAFSIYTYESTRHKKIVEQYKSSFQKSFDIVNKGSSSQGFSLKSLARNIAHLIPKQKRHSIARFYLRHFARQKTYYQYYQLIGDKFQITQTFNIKLFNIDGHPSFTTNQKYMITDSYPTEKQFHRLIVYNIMRKKAIRLAEIYAGLHLKPGSCDLHPKLSKNNNYLSVDTAHNGIHQMIVFKLDWDKINREFNEN